MPQLKAKDTRVSNWFSVSGTFAMEETASSELRQIPLQDHRGLFPQDSRELTNQRGSCRTGHLQQLA